MARLTRGLFFDIGNTLAADPFPLAAPVLVDAMINHGTLARSQREISLERLAVANREVDGLGFSHFWGEEQILAEWLRRIGSPPTDTLVRECLHIYREAVNRAYKTTPELLAMKPSELRRLLCTVASQGFKIGAISDEREASIPRYWEVLGVGDLFDIVVTSEGVGVSKPSREIFEVALAQAGTRPVESVYVGNDYHRDIEGARSLGMKTVYFTKFNGYPPDADRSADLVTDDLASIYDFLRL